jgi:imidazoleglycerol-phosphate dehydratase
MSRSASVSRTTKETSIEVTIELDGSGAMDVQTPLPFLSHMVEQIAKHGLFDLRVRATGDTEIDGHHTTEDLGFVLGQAVAKALGDKAKIARYGWATLPMDEARSGAAIDLGGRPFYVGKLGLQPGAKIGTWDVELADVFFEAFARGAMCNLHVTREEGTLLHHIVEITFKAFAKALMLATRIEPRMMGVPSTKGTLQD